MGQEVEAARVRIVNVRAKPEGLADKKFVEFLHDRQLKRPFVQAADCYANWERKFTEVK